MLFILPEIGVTWVPKQFPLERVYLRCAGTDEVRQLITILLRSEADKITVDWENELEPDVPAQNTETVQEEQP